MRICVFGAASSKIDDAYVVAVEKLSEELAKRGHTLVFGAGASGLMGAAARGFKRGGAHIIGVIPTFFREESIEIIYKECDEIIYTETMQERKLTMETLADAFITVPGGIGTFEELFEILTLKQLNRHKKPIAIYDFDGYYDEIEVLLKVAIEKKFVPDNCTMLYKCTDSVDEIIDYIENSEYTMSIEEVKNS